jgi:hypothetical protein
VNALMSEARTIERLMVALLHEEDDIQARQARSIAELDVAADDLLRVRSRYQSLRSRLHEIEAELSD